jgi:organic radical activating enzyme
VENTQAMTPWQAFYQSVKESSWPECKLEQDFYTLPKWIQQECKTVHGYKPGEYAQQSQLMQKVFPIETATACQLKWNWSTIYLTTEKTASCHRSNLHQFDTSKFDFHNTPSKLQDRNRMLQGQWPERGCEYCQNIEQAGGESDRTTNLNMPGMHAPPELEVDAHAIDVTPRILEVYFDNTCNLKCVYCGPYFSSLWDAENKQHGAFSKNGLTIDDGFIKSADIETNKQRLFDWLKQHGKTLSTFNILGGEPLYQSEFDQCLDFFEQYAAPDLDLQIFTNLNSKLDRVQKAVKKVRELIDSGKIRKFTVTASLDCWGAPQEYARYPLKLDVWQRNFEYLLSQEWITVVVGSTITPLTVHTLPDLIERMNVWREQIPIYHYFNSVNSPSHMYIDIFGDLFKLDFDRAISIMPSDTKDQQKAKSYLQGIAKQSIDTGVNYQEVLKLHTFLDEMDRRRDTDWRSTFPWLVPAFKQILKI